MSALRRNRGLGGWPALAGVLAALFLLSACGGGIGRNIPIFDRSHDREQTSGLAADGTWVVGKGDTVYGIARTVGVSTRTLIDANNLRPPYVVVPGQRLQLPGGARMAGGSYVVRAGDSVSKIAQRIGADTREVIAANNLQPPYTIYVGQVLRLPGQAPRQTSSAQPANTSERGVVPRAAPVEGVSGSGSDALPSAEPSPAREPAEVAAAPVARGVINTAEPPPASGSGFIWPVRGRVISSYGSTPDGLHNDGVNIAAPKGAPIRASENGVVAYAGNQIRGFGNLVLIKHEGGTITAYAHADEILVKRGETVTRGQVIARVGMSGGVTAPQLHFEVREGTRAVDPSRFLPST